MDFGTIRDLEGNLIASGKAALDTLIPMRAISNDLFAIERAQFVSQGRRGGGSWAKLKPDTIARKGHAQILRDTRALVDSVTRRDAPFQILEVRNTELIFGTDRPWAGVHQHGSAYKNRPARPFIKILPTDVSRWTSMIARHLTRPFQNENLRHYFTNV